MEFSSRHKYINTFYTSHLTFISVVVIHIKYLKYVYFSSEFKIFTCDHCILHCVIALPGGIQV
jgi:hypothetical protein